MKNGDSDIEEIEGYIAIGTSEFSFVIMKITKNGS
jgi:hypothetical protein